MSVSPLVLNSSRQTTTEPPPKTGWLATSGWSWSRSTLVLTWNSAPTDMRSRASRASIRGRNAGVRPGRRGRRPVPNTFASSFFTYDSVLRMQPFEMRTLGASSGTGPAPPPDRGRTRQAPGIPSAVAAERCHARRKKLWREAGGVKWGRPRTVRPRHAPGSAMSSEGSVSRWVTALKGGDPAAAQPLWERYHRQLVALARQRLQAARRRAADEEDVVQSAFHSFFDGVARGRFPQLDDRDNLWRLLVVITARKALDQLARDHAKRRGGGTVQGESRIGPGGAD